MADIKITPSINSAIQNASPTTGQTVVMTDDDKDGGLHLTPAGSLLTLTITFPSDAKSRLGQIRSISSTQTITTLTVGGASMLNAIAAITANECFTFKKVSSNTWIRCI